MVLVHYTRRQVDFLISNYNDYDRFYNFNTLLHEINELTEAVEKEFLKDSYGGNLYIFGMCKDKTVIQFEFKNKMAYHNYIKIVLYRYFKECDDKGADGGSIYGACDYKLFKRDKAGQEVNKSFELTGKKFKDLTF